MCPKIHDASSRNESSPIIAVSMWRFPRMLRRNRWWVSVGGTFAITLVSFILILLEIVVDDYIPTAMDQQDVFKIQKMKTPFLVTAPWLFALFFLSSRTPCSAWVIAPPTRSLLVHQRLGPIARRRTPTTTGDGVWMNATPARSSLSKDVVDVNFSSSSGSENGHPDEHAPHRLIAFSGDDLIPVLDDETASQLLSPTSGNGGNDLFNAILNTYWGPRIVLAAIAAVYGTNFALGSLMNDSLPAAAVTTSRMTLAAVALLPFLSRISPQLRHRAVACGVVTAAGYVTQSLALTSVDPARVSFLGAATVLWCPLLEWAVDRVPMGWKDAPQTWMAAVLCLTGVGILELYDPSGGTSTSISMDTMGGDILALLQAVAFGTGCFLNAKMIREEPTQVLPVTAVLITVTAALAWVWCGIESLVAGTFIFDPVQLVTDPALHPVAMAVLWTGLVSTVFNLVVEVSALGRVPSSEASVLLATEPVWAAVFAAILLGNTLQINDYVGGAFIIGACLVNAIVKPQDVQQLFAWTTTTTNQSNGIGDDNGNNKE